MSVLQDFWNDRYDDGGFSGVLYRMVFGQHRQEDLITYLRQRFSDEQIVELVEVCRIDLSPPCGAEP